MRWTYRARGALYGPDPVEDVVPVRERRDPRVRTRLFFGEKGERYANLRSNEGDVLRGKNDAGGRAARRRFKLGLRRGVPTAVGLERGGFTHAP